MLCLAESRATIDHRNRIVTRAAPGMTSANSFQSEPASPQRAVCFYRLQKIFRTGRLKSTAGTRAAKQSEQRRKRELIKTNKNANESAHQAARIEARFARRNHSASNS